MSRDTSVGGADEALDGLRGVAALMVVFCHCGAVLAQPPLVIFGFTGVHLFFVLSGYLISKPFLTRLAAGRPPPSLRNYAIRRFTRVYPTYFAALVFFTLMRVVTHLHPPTLGNLVAHALLVFNFGDHANFCSLNAVFWSLAIEAQFYVILPLALAGAARATRGVGHRAILTTLIAFTCIGPASRAAEYVMSRGSPEVRFCLPSSFLDLFAMGIAVAYLELGSAAWLRERIKVRWGLCIGAVAVYLLGNNWLLGAGCDDWFKPPSAALACFYPTIICFAFGALLLAIRTRAKRGVPPLTYAAATFFGRISYSVYLYHIAIGYVILAKLPARQSFWLGTHNFTYGLAELPVVIAFSYVAYRLVELPSVSLGARFSLREPARELRV